MAGSSNGLSFFISPKAKTREPELTWADTASLSRSGQADRESDPSGLKYGCSRLRGTRCDGKIRYTNPAADETQPATAQPGQTGGELPSAAMKGWDAGKIAGRFRCGAGTGAIVTVEWATRAHGTGQAPPRPDQVPERVTAPDARRHGMSPRIRGRKQCASIPASIRR